MNNGFSYIRRWMWLYWLIVALSAAAVFVLVYHEISNTLDMQYLEVPAASHSSDKSPLIGPSSIKLRVFLLLTTGYLFILLISIVWLRSAIHKINRPILKIQRAVSHLAQGKLNETVEIGSSDEFGQIGAGINELAANLQELLLYIWKQTGQCMNILEQIQHHAGDCQGEALTAKADAQIQQLSESIDNLREMAKAYVFYDVRLEGEKALAINRPGKTEPSGAPLTEDKKLQ
jgi:methyl-accepting chemotaxis protein